jgi:hypothetical protein
MPNTNITNEVAGWFGANPALAHGNYVIKKVEATYKKNYDVVQASPSNSAVDATVAKITALRVLDTVSGTAFTSPQAEMRGYLKESQKAVGTGELRSANNLALPVEKGIDANFTYTGGGSIRVTAHSSPLPLATVAVGDYVAVKNRSNTLGVVTLVESTNGSDAGVAATVLETAVYPFHAGGQLARQPGVEWQVIAGVKAAVNFNAVTGQGVVVSAAGADFTGVVQVGDYVHLTARTTAPTTTNPTIAGYYRVQQVAASALLLERKAYTRTGEGVYVQSSSALPNIDDVADFTVLRTRANALFLRHAGQLFTGVQTGDWLRTDYSGGRVFQVQEVPTLGLMLLVPTNYSGTSAPYTLDNTTIPDFTATVSYSVTRAPYGQLASFTLTDPSATFTGVAHVGDFVQLTARSGPLDPTVDPATTVGYYLITNVATHTLELSNQRYQLNSSTFSTTGQSVYKSYNDRADYHVFKSTRTYPYSRDTDGSPIIYQVMSKDGTGFDLYPQRYHQYDPVLFEMHYQTLAGSVSAFQDFFDFDLIKVYGPKLYLYKPGADFSAVTAGANTFMLGKARLLPPATSSTRTSTVNAAYAVESKPSASNEVLFLSRTPSQGRQLDSANPAQRFAPYDAHPSLALSDGSWKEPCDYRVVLQDPTTFEKVELVGLTTGVASAIHVGDYLAFTSGAPREAAADLHPGAFTTVLFKVIGTGATSVTLDQDHVYISSVGTPPIGVNDLDELPFDPTTYSSFAYGLTGAAKRRATTTDYMVLKQGVFNNAITPGSDYALIKFKPPSSTTYLTLTVLVHAFGGGTVTLYPFEVTGADGTFAITTNPFTYDFRNLDVVHLQIVRPNGQLDMVNDYLAAFNTGFALPGEVGKKAALDARLANIFRADVDDARNRETAEFTLGQLAQLVPDQQVTLRGFGEGGATGTPGTLTVKALADALNGMYVAGTPMAQVIQYQNALAAACVVDVIDALKTKTVQDLKDLYIDFYLQQLGWTSDAAFVDDPFFPATSDIKASVKAQALGKADFAARMVTAISKIFVDRGRNDIAGVLTSQLNNLVPLVRDALPVNYGTFKDRYFVRDGGQADFTTSFAGFLAFFVKGLASDQAKARRQAFQGLIGVPPEPSLRQRKRSYSRARNKGRMLRTHRGDLQNHASQTNDPNLLQVLGNKIADLGNQILDADAITNSIAGFLLPMGELPPPLFGSGVSPDDQQAVVDQMANENAEDAPPGNASLSNASIPQAPITSTVSASVPRTTPTFDTLREPALQGVTVTNLFDKDIHDFRVTHAIVPYYTLNSSRFENASNVASISLVDFDFVPVDDVIDLGELGTLDVDSSGIVAYNQFMLTTVGESYAEKFQLDDTLLGSFVMFLMGEKPEVWSMNGNLINDIASDQVSKFRALYENYIRGSVLAQQQQLVCLTVPAISLKLYCVPVALNIQANSDGSDVLVPFSMQFVKVAHRQIPMFRKLNTPSVPISNFVSFLHKQTGLVGRQGGTGRSSARTKPGAAPLPFGPTNEELGVLGKAVSAITDPAGAVKAATSAFQSVLDAPDVMPRLFG